MVQKAYLDIDIQIPICTFSKPNQHATYARE